MSTNDIRRLSITEVEATINKIFYYYPEPDAENDTTTICKLVLYNGMAVTGVSGCVDTKGYDEKLGEQYAYEDALRKAFILLAHKVRSEMTGV